MIDPRELKIGNYLFDDEGCVIRINGFQPHGHSSRCDESEGCILLFDIYSQDGKIREGYENESDSCNPIPLTPEWLERIGMHKRFPSDTCNIWDSKDENLRNKSMCLALLKEGWVYPTAPGAIPFHYLHQLQNLYYALTGKELEITNP